jgi:hypothetical protein
VESGVSMAKVIISLFSIAEHRLKVLYSLILALPVCALRSAVLCPSALPQVRASWIL